MRCRNIHQVTLTLDFTSLQYNIKVQMMELMKFDCGGTFSMERRAVNNRQPRLTVKHFRLNYACL